MIKSETTFKLKEDLSLFDFKSELDIYVSAFDLTEKLTKSLRPVHREFTQLEQLQKVFVSPFDIQTKRMYDSPAVNNGQLKTPS